VTLIPTSPIRPRLTIVRRVRERIAREHGGDLRKHVEETNRIAAEVRAKLKVKVVAPPVPERGRAGVGG